MAYEYDFNEWFQGLCEIPNDAKNLHMLAANHHATLLQHIPDSRNLPIENIMDVDEEESLMGKRMDHESRKISHDSALNCFGSHLPQSPVMPGGRPLMLTASLSLEDYHHAAIMNQEEHFTLGGAPTARAGQSAPAGGNTTAFRLLIEDDNSHPSGVVSMDSNYDSGVIADLRMLHMQTPTTIPAGALESPMMFFNPNTVSTHAAHQDRESYNSRN